MTFKLRDYQQEQVDKTSSLLRNGEKKILLVSPTGSGKTAVSSHMVKKCHESGKKTMFICHRRELLTQTYETYRKNDINPAFIKSGINPNYENNAQIALINTLIKRTDRVKAPDYIFWDECAFIASNTWTQVFDLYKNSIHIGLTATPCRLDGKPLSKYFDEMVCTINTSELIKRGFLVPFEYYAPSVIDTKELKKGGNGDYTAKSLEEASFTGKIIGDNISQYLSKANGKRNIVFAINRLHGQEILQRYKEAGVSAEYIDGTTSDKDRREGIQRFREGATKVLINVNLFSEGFDIPSIEVVSLLRPTMSTALYLQQVGRGLRTSLETGKQKLIVLDHVNNYLSHGMPDDIREWSLEEGLKQTRKNEISKESFMRCPNCYFAHDKALICPNCGFAYKANNKEIKELVGELVLIGSERYEELKKQEIVFAKTLLDLVKIERDRKYKFGWAEKVWESKTNKKLWYSMSGLEEIANARGYSSGWVWQQKRIRGI